MLTIKEFEKMYNVHFTLCHEGKMSEFWSLSTSCRVNIFCQSRINIPGSICSHCYAERMQKVRNALEKNLIDNYNVLTTVLIPIENLPLIITPTGYFRFEAFGDLATEIQAANYINMAKYNPCTKFALWTKNPGIIKSALKKFNLVKPENLCIIGSSLFVNQVTDYTMYDFIDYTFTVYDKRFAIDNNVEITCGARICLDCHNCYTKGHNGYYINELLK